MVKYAVDTMLTDIWATLVTRLSNTTLLYLGITALFLVLRISHSLSASKISKLVGLEQKVFCCRRASFSLFTWTPKGQTSMQRPALPMRVLDYKVSVLMMSVSHLWPHNGVFVVLMPPAVWVCLPRCSFLNNKKVEPHPTLVHGKTSGGEEPHRCNTGWFLDRMCDPGVYVYGENLLAELVRTVPWNHTHLHVSWCLQGIGCCSFPRRQERPWQAASLLLDPSCLTPFQSSSIAHAHNHTVIVFISSYISFFRFGAMPPNRKKSKAQRAVEKERAEVAQIILDWGKELPERKQSSEIHSWMVLTCDCLF